MHILFLICAILVTFVFNAPGAVAKTYFHDSLIKLTPQIRFNLGPSDMRHTLLLPSNPDGIDATIKLSFNEAKNYYGFTAMICDLENKRKYLNSEKSNCKRQTIDSSRETMRINTSGDKGYEIFIINRGGSVRLSRDVTITSLVTVSLPEKVKNRTRELIEDIQGTLTFRHSIKPLYFAIVPCSRGVYVPSDYDSRALTLCSELVLNEFLAPGPDLLRGTLFTEYAPFFVRDVKIPEKLELKSDKGRIVLGLAMYMTFITSMDPIKRYAEFIVQTPYLARTLERSRINPAFTYQDHVRILKNIIVNPLPMVNEELRQIYAAMDQDTLRQIREAEYVHYGALRNEARLILKMRHEEEKAEKERQERLRQQQELQGKESGDLVDQIF